MRIQVSDPGWKQKDDISCSSFRSWYKSSHTRVRSLQSCTQDVRKVYTELFLSVAFILVNLHSGTLWRLWYMYVFSVKAGQKLQGRKLVSIDIMTSKLDWIKWKQEGIYTASFVSTTSDVTRSLNSVPGPGHCFAPKSRFRRLKTALSIRIWQKQNSLWF